MGSGSIANPTGVEASGKSYQRSAIEAFLTTTPASSGIRAVVASADVQKRLVAFETADAAAVRNQARYRRVGRLALWAATIGTLIGAILLLPLDTWITSVSRGVIGAAQTVTLIITFLAIQWIGWRKPIDRWMVQRAEAERLRGAIFQAIVTAKAPTGADTAGLAVQRLDCLMAAHANDQLDFFDKSSAKNRKAAGRATPLRLLGYLLIGLATVLGAAALTCSRCRGEATNQTRKY